jgi:hypothetical protein
VPSICDLRCTEGYIGELLSFERGRGINHQVYGIKLLSYCSSLLLRKTPTGALRLGLTHLAPDQPHRYLSLVVVGGEHSVCSYRPSGRSRLLGMLVLDRMIPVTVPAALPPIRSRPRHTRVLGSGNDSDLLIRLGIDRSYPGRSAPQSSLSDSMLLFDISCRGNGSMSALPDVGGMAWYFDGVLAASAPLEPANREFLTSILA